MYNEIHFHPNSPNTMSTAADLPSNAIDDIAFKFMTEAELLQHPMSQAYQKILIMSQLGKHLYSSC